MHLIEPIRACIDDIIRSIGSGMKSLLLDDFTTGVISASYSRSDMLLREFYMFESINTIFESSERLNHMKCIVIIRPTKDNVQRICKELNRPHYKTYYIYFTSRVGSTLVKRIGEADEIEAVRCIRELPLDFQSINPFLFSLQMDRRTFDLRNEGWQPDGLKRASDGLASALIAIQVNPLIRYQTHSPLCKELAEKVSNIIKNEAIANKTWRKSAPFDINSLLIIVDRRSDLVTPLVNKWTYYSMIHEQFNIANNRISLIDTPNRQTKDPKEMLVSVENDQFFEENFYKNYGELGATLKQAVENLKNFSKSQHKVETMDDMKRFIEEYPETKRYAANLHNHVFLMSEMTRIVTEHNLFSVSECEQDMACGSASNSEIIKKIRPIISSSSVRAIDALRLVSIYTICKPEKSGLNDLLKLLKTRPDITADDIEFIGQLREFNLSKPQNPLDETILEVTRMLVKNVKGVENVLTQFKPRLSKILDDLRRGNKLRESDFAFCGERYKEEPPRKIIVFFVGGATYEEGLIADHHNRSQTGSNVQIIVGGTCIHNFRSFKDEVTQAIVDSQS